jgi:hypothetical protein
VDHLEVASEVVGAQELLLDAAVGRDAEFPRTIGVRQQLGYRRPSLLEVARVR